jgi:hypothetical protein
VSTCACGLPIGELPAEVKHWHPERDPEPKDVRVVARWGQDPKMRRAVRIADGKWAEYGFTVSYYLRISPIEWHEVGMCSAGISHPVVAVEPPPL